MPDPLPPQLPLSAGLWRVLSEADRALGELAGLGRTMPNPYLLIAPFVRREAVLSSRIEGTQTTIRDLYVYEARQRALPGFEPAPRHEDVREVHNYVKALEYGLERLKQLPVSLRLLRETHERLLEGVRGEDRGRGEFRRIQNYIGSREASIQDAEFVFPPPSYLVQTLNAFEAYLHEKDDYPPLVRLALIHYQFETIHPFVDGNGRMGRLLISLLLAHWGLLPQHLLYLSAYFERHRSEYISRMRAVSMGGDWSGWIEFFLRGVAEQAHDAIDRSRRLQDLRVEWHAMLQESSRSALLLRVADLLFELPTVTAPHIQERFDVSHRSAMQSIRALQRAGILTHVPETRRPQVFIAGPILDVLE